MVAMMECESKAYSDLPTFDALDDFLTFPPGGSLADMASTEYRSKIAVKGVKVSRETVMKVMHAVERIMRMMPEWAVVNDFSMFGIGVTMETFDRLFAGVKVLVKNEPCWIKKKVYIGPFEIGCSEYVYRPEKEKPEPEFEEVTLKA